MPENLALLEIRPLGIVVQVKQGYLGRHGHVVPLSGQAQFFNGDNAEDKAQQFAEKHGYIVVIPRQLSNPVIETR
jgi:hypothetical protein